MMLEKFFWHGKFQQSNNNSNSNNNHNHRGGFQGNNRRSRGRCHRGNYRGYQQQQNNLGSTFFVSTQNIMFENYSKIEKCNYIYNSESNKKEIFFLFASDCSSHIINIMIAIMMILKFLISPLKCVSATVKC